MYYTLFTFVSYDLHVHVLGSFLQAGTIYSDQPVRAPVHWQFSGHFCCLSAAKELKIYTNLICQWFLYVDVLGVWAFLAYFWKSYDLELNKFQGFDSFPDFMGYPYSYWLANFILEFIWMGYRSSLILL